MSTISLEGAPVAYAGKRRLRDAISALRALLKDPNDTAQGFRLLEALDPSARFKLVKQIVELQLRVLRVKDEIADQIREEMSRSQREYVLRHQPLVQTAR